MAGAALLIFATPASLTSPGDRSPAASEIQTPARTAKERLVNKASDEQRINNCKVPVPLRGSKPRPNGCREGQDDVEAMTAARP